MARQLYLLRHGLAEDPSPAVRDEERRLTERGRRKMLRAALGLKRMGVVPDAILSSPLRRAWETAELLGRVLAPDRSVEEFSPLTPGTSPAEVLSALGAARGARSVFLVGHEPMMGELFSYLLTGASTLIRVNFKKGAVAAFVVSALPPRDRASLLWFLSSKQLRAIAQ